MANGERPPQRALGDRLGPFRHPAYAVYWTGGFVSNLGTWLQAVAGSIYVYQLTQSSFAVGVFNFAGFIPILLFSVWGGQLSDRFDRRTVVIWTHVVSFVAAAVLAVATVAGQANELLLIGIVFLLNTLWAIGKPSLVSLIPNIVPREDLQDAVGLNSLQFIGGQIVGPLLAAFVMATSGAGVAFTINAFTYLGPIVAMLYLVRVGMAGPGTAAARGERARAAAVSAVAFVRQHVWVPALLVGIVASAAAVEIQRTLAPALVSEVLHEPESAAGIIVAAQSVGSAIALFLFVPIRRRGWSRGAALAGYAFQGVGVTTVAFAPSLAVACIGVGFIGFGFSLCFPVLTAVLQEETPDALRGRVMSYHQMAHLGNRPFTALFVGSVAAAVGTQGGVLAGLVLAPIGILAVRTAWRALADERRGAGSVDPDAEPAIAG
jgi:MFS family permease